MNIPAVTRKDNVSPKQPIAPFAPLTPPHPISNHTPVSPTPQPIEKKTLKY
ncbi:hypothetical protein [Microcoleus vaginatus]|uniref:hypothetical protein n=1 Tax=Microcoleus vaginatus TaxID=119532 RepID=UPI00168381E4|nr:hypothetical protein [Microcoleus sp. FACHB-84]MBD2008082.1 hypothetical protein [Microcoleus sp. FACHB-45]